MKAPKKTTMLQRFLEVKGAPYTREQLQRLALLTDEATVGILFNLFSGQDLAEVLRDASENRLEPAVREVLDMIDHAGFVSSYEVKMTYGIQPSTASNRMSSLARSGLVRTAFDYVPKGGGKRTYYCRAERPEDSQAVEQFVEGLSAAGVG